MENSYGKLSKLEDTLSGVENIFFIGIGGISMSSLAMIAKDRGYTVSHRLHLFTGRKQNDFS